MSRSNWEEWEQRALTEIVESVLRASEKRPSKVTWPVLVFCFLVTLLGLLLYRVR